MSGPQLRIVPYNGDRRYKYYLDGYKVNGKRKRLFFRDEGAANRKLAELARQQKKEGQNGLDIPLDLRVLAAKAAQAPGAIQQECAGRRRVLRKPPRARKQLDPRV